MGKNQKIVFSFDDSAMEPIEKMVRQGRHSAEYQFGYEEIEITIPETGEKRTIVLPKSESPVYFGVPGARCPHCGR